MSYIKYIFGIFISFFVFSAAFAQVLTVNVQNSTSGLLYATLKSKTESMEIPESTPISVQPSSTATFTVWNQNTSTSGEGFIQIYLPNNAGECDFHIRYNKNAGVFYSNLTTSTGALMEGHCSAIFPNATTMNISIK